MGIMLSKRRIRCHPIMELLQKHEKLAVSTIANYIDDSIKATAWQLQWMEMRGYVHSQKEHFAGAVDIKYYSIYGK